MHHKGRVGSFGQIHNGSIKSSVILRLPPHIRRLMSPIMETLSMRTVLKSFPDRRRLLQFVIAASVALAYASLAGCANMKRPSTAFDYSRTTGDSKEVGSHGRCLNHH